MKYLIFGAGGFVGKNLVSYLRAENNIAISVQRDGKGDYKVDITSKDSFSVLNAIKDIDIIINCASVLPDNTKQVIDTDYLSSLFQTNVMGAANILNFAAAKKIKRVINCSTLAVVNKPWPIQLKEADIALPTGNHTGYAASKLTQELVMNEIAVKHNTELTHLRLSALYGAGMAWQGILPLMVEKIMNNEKISLTNANKVSFDFLFVDDLVKIIYRLSKLPKLAPVINVASGEEIYLEKLVADIIHLTQSGSVIELQNNEQPSSRSSVDISLLKKSLADGIDFTSMQNGLKTMIAYYREAICAI